MKKKKQLQNRRLEKSAGAADCRKFKSLGSRGDVKQLAITQNYFNRRENAIN